MKLSPDMAKKRYFLPKKTIQVHETSCRVCSNLCITIMSHKKQIGDETKVKKYDYPVSPIFLSVVLTSRAKTAVKNSPKKIQMEQVGKHL